MKENQKIHQHIAGASIMHSNPFTRLSTPKNSKPIDQELINKLVVPIYMNLLEMNRFENELIIESKKIIKDINIDAISIMLGDFNWRTRSTGAFFSAIRNYLDFQDVLGNLLLKSELTYAGKIYCLAQVEFNNQKSIEFLNRYLNYYLDKPELWFDQDQAIGALGYLDKKNGTNEIQKHLEKWNRFVSNKPNWCLKSSIEGFEKSINCLRNIKKQIN